MSLADRLAAVHGHAADPTTPALPDLTTVHDLPGVAEPFATPMTAPVTAPVAAPVAVPSGGLASRLARTAPEAAGGAAPTDSPVRVVDTLTQLKDRASRALFERLGSKLSDADIPEEQLHAMVRADLQRVIAFEQTPLSGDDKRRLIAELTDEVLGYGPLQPLLDDPAVTEVMVNGPDTVYVERGGRIVRTTAGFASEEHLRRVIERIVSRVGRRIDESSPLVDARLPDGSRVNAIIAPLAFSGSALTIRKFSRKPLHIDDLITFGTLSAELAELLHGCVQARLNIIVSGGTGTGKTTLLNVLSSFIPEGERIITIEDAVELQLQQEHVVRLESRPANIEGKGDVSIRDLVRNSLRMRPDRIIVGEVRGGESLDMLQAMNTGHDGSLSTVHANSPRDAVARLETLVLMSGMDLPLRAVREQVAAAVDLIVQVSRLRDGSRRITSVTEVLGMEGDTVTLQDAYVFDHAAGADADGRLLGRAEPTGVRPRFLDRFLEQGVPLPARALPAVPSPVPVVGRFS